MFRLNDFKMYVKDGNFIITSAEPSERILGEMVFLRDYAGRNFKEFDFAGYAAQVPQKIEQINFPVFDIAEQPDRCKYAISAEAHVNVAFAVLPDNDTYIAHRNAIRQYANGQQNEQFRLLFCRLNGVYCYYRHGSIFISTEDRYL